MPSAVQGLSRQVLEELAAERQEPTWLVQRRQAGWDAFQTLPTPDWTRGIRGWWNGALKPIDFDELQPFTPAGSALPDFDLSGNAEEGAPSGVIVQYNSQVVRVELSEAARAAGVVLSSLEEAVKTHPQIVEKYFMTQAVPVAEDRFTAMNAAFWSGGVFLYVPKGVVLDAPFRAIFFADQPHTALFTHTLIVTEGHTKARLIEEHRSTGEAGDPLLLDSGITEIFVGEGSTVEYYDAQEYAENVTNISVKRAIVGKNGLMRWMVATLGSDTTRLTLESNLNGEGSHAETTALAFPNHHQNFDTQTRQLHSVPHTTANSVFKQVLDDQSQLGFRGGIRTIKKAQFTESFLQVHTLYLNEASKADTLPYLDVDANDVRCSHGATTGMIDKEQIFYLMSRGLSRDQAEEMIVAGFFEEAIERVPLESVRQKLRAAIEAKLG